MAKRSTIAQQLALKAAAAARDVPDDVPATPILPVSESEPLPAASAPPAATKQGAPDDEAPPARNRGGRPKGRRDVHNKQTVYLDERRYRALARAADDKGRSIHSLILEGIDLVTGKPTISTWD